MKMPNTYSPKQIKHWGTDEEYKPNYWRPARPMSLDCLSLLTRIKMAWSVFTGRNDVLDWEKED